MKDQDISYEGEQSLKLSNQLPQHWDIANFLLGRPHLSTLKLFLRKNYIFLPYRCLKSSWSAFSTPSSQSLSEPHKIVYFFVGRTSNRQGNSNAHKIIVLRPVDPEKIRAEL